MTINGNRIEILILASRAKENTVVGGRKIVEVKDGKYKINKAKTCQLTYRYLLPGIYKWCVVEKRTNNK